MNLFEQEWDEWAALCMKSDASPQSQSALKIAFHCGALTWVRLVQRITSEHDPLDTVVLLSDLTAEMGDYANGLREMAVRHGRPNEYEQ